MATELWAKVKINGWHYQAILDSGSAVGLVQPTVLPPCVESKTLLPITCVHGDTRQVPAHSVTVSAAPGTWPIEVGVVKDLPIPMLLGRDQPGFDRLLAARVSACQPHWEPPKTEDDPRSPATARLAGFGQCQRR